MKVILKEDMENLGNFGDAVKVANGYARNYLIPRGLAVEASEGSMKQFESQKEARTKKISKQKGDAEKLAGEISLLQLDFQRKAGEDDKLFGSVTSMDIESALGGKGYRIDRKNILLPEPIKALGVFTVSVRLHPEVKAEFKVSDAMDSVGGISYIGQMAEATPTAANIMYYANIVREKSLSRKLINAATEIVRRGYESSDSIEDFVDDAERIIFEASQDRIKKTFYALKDLTKDTFETIEKLYEKKSHITGVPPCFKEIGRLTAGLQNSDLIIIAGRPSMGKTAFALNIAEHV